MSLPFDLEDIVGVVDFLLGPILAICTPLIVNH